MRRKRAVAFFSLVAAAAFAAGTYYSIHRHRPRVIGTIPGTVSAKHSDEEAAVTPPRLAKRSIARIDPELAASLCTRFEYPGRGSSWDPANDPISNKDWQQVMTRFHNSKDSLIRWIDARKEKWGEGTTSRMKELVRSTQIQRPHRLNELDLSWRGTGVWTRKDGETPMIRLGDGFLREVLDHPVQAQFELTRMVAQSIAPCELKRAEGEAVWQPLLKCLEVKEDGESCKGGRFSEAAWAQSTALAAVLTPPECTIPAFASTDAAGCLKEIR